MSAIITANERLARDNRAPSPALKDDGTNFQWRMFYDNNRLIADFDETADAFEIFSPGYTSFSVEDKLAERTRLAQQVQLLARSTVLANLDPEQQAALEPWELNVLLYQGENNNDPHGWDDGTGKLGEDDEDAVDFWKSDVPLILVSTSYAPYTKTIRPLSIEGDYEEVKNIIWLRPESELALLESFTDIGYITFGRPMVEDVYA